MTNIKATNPKDGIGSMKVPLHLLSPIASALWAHAQFVGERKYQRWNWRAAEVVASIYIAAAKRHIEGYNSGERLDPTDGTHHLGNVMACCAILLDAEAADTLIDDRPPTVSHRPTYDFVEAAMRVTMQTYAHIPQHPHTILNTIVKPNNVNL